MRNSQASDEALGEAAGGVYHGGDLDVASRRFPEGPRPWIDLSTGINARPYPVPVLSSAAWTRLPSRDDIAALEAAAGRFFGVRDPALVVAAPGTQALLQLMPGQHAGQATGVVGFTYQEHLKVWRDAGRPVSVVEQLEDLAGFDIGVVVNPNNPDGRRSSPANLGRIAAALAARGGRLIVDEAFLDLDGPGDSLIPQLPSAGAVVVRSFGKTWGLAGLRLGFLVADAATAAAYRARLGPWAVSGAAVEIGIAAYQDTAWLAATRQRLAGEAVRLDALLVAVGFEIVGGTRLFRLARHGEAARWFAHLGRAGILTRPFPARPDWLRFGLPGTEAEWERLGATLGRGINA